MKIHKSKDKDWLMKRGNKTLHANYYREPAHGMETKQTIRQKLTTGKEHHDIKKSTLQKVLTIINRGAYNMKV